jgi:hypothetical protein
MPFVNTLHTNERGNLFLGGAEEPLNTPLRNKLCGKGLQTVL